MTDGSSSTTTATASTTEDHTEEEEKAIKAALRKDELLRKVRNFLLKSTQAINLYISKAYFPPVLRNGDSSSSDFNSTLGEVIK